MNNFGIIYKSRDSGKFLLFASYPNEEAMANDMANNPDIPKIDSDEVYLVDITNCPLHISKKEEGEEQNNGKQKNSKQTDSK